jgi:hypothetical protein
MPTICDRHCSPCPQKEKKKKKRQAAETYSEGKGQMKRKELRSLR